MHRARLTYFRLLSILIVMIVSGLSPAGAYASDPLPDELRWHPASEVRMPQVDSIVPVAPRLANWGMSPYAADSGENEIVDEDNRNWWYLFRKGKLAMNDTSVQWPKFLGFCVKVYNWGDRVFSATNPDYVVGTGKKWKARIINDNWADSYYMKFSNKFNTLMSTPFHVLWGASLQYMAVSYTYSVDASHLWTGSPINYKKQEFGFNCARFSAEGYYYSNSATYIRKFGKYNERRVLKDPFSGIDMSIFGLDAYYFINGYKYSQGAAYNFSKIQKKSQGCVMAGFAYCNQNIALDFSKLPADLKPYLTVDDKLYRFHYNDYNLLVGYGYNVVISPHWLYNITVIPGVGFNHCYEDSEFGSAKLFSLSGRAMTSFTFNSGNWFAGLQGKVRGHWYRSSRILLFNTVENIVVSGGIRF